jgi:hypothetical protein
MNNENILKEMYNTCIKSIQELKYTNSSDTNKQKKAIDSLNQQLGFLNLLNKNFFDSGKINERIFNFYDKFYKDQKSLLIDNTTLGISYTGSIPNTFTPDIDEFNPNSNSNSLLQGPVNPGTGQSFYGNMGGKKRKSKKSKKRKSKKSKRRRMSRRR